MTLYLLKVHLQTFFWGQNYLQIILTLITNVHFDIQNNCKINYTKASQCRLKKSFLVSYLNCLLIISKVLKERFTKCIDVTSAYSTKLSDLQASGNFWYSETLGLSSLFGVIKKQHEPELNAYTIFTLHAFQCQVRRRPTKSLNSGYVTYGQARFSLYAFSMYILNIETESHNCFFPYPRHTI
jgi:hypothetical protein